MARHNWKPVLNIPEKTVGEMSIKHEVVPAGTPISFATQRTKFLGGREVPKNITFREDVTYHWLVEKDRGVWTSDLPIEQFQQFRDVQGLRGNVLVGGLGIGMIAEYLAKKKSVKSVTVVELSKDVVDLVSPHLSSKVNVVNQDLFEYLRIAKTDGIRFDHAFYDIWRSDGEFTFFRTVCPLVELSEGVVKHDPRNWNEGVMRGQLYLSLRTKMFRMSAPQMFGTAKQQLPDVWEEIETGKLGPDYDVIFHNWAVPFFKWVKEKNPSEEVFAKAQEYYVKIYGKWNWKQTWERIVVNYL